MFIRKICSALAVITLATASFSSVAGDLYKVSTSLSHKGKAFASPTVVVKSGVSATVEMSGPEGFKLTLTVTDAGGDKLKIVANLESSHGSMAPVLVVRSGQAATISVGDIELGLTAEPHGS